MCFLRRVIIILILMTFLSIMESPWLRAQNVEDYYQVDYASVEFSKTEIHGAEIFYASTSVSITCIRNVPINISQGRFTYRVIAEHKVSGNITILNPSYTIDITPFPTMAGDIYEINEAVPLQFDQVSESGDYDIVLELTRAELRVFSSWYDITGDIPEEQRTQFIGMVGYAPWTVITENVSNITPSSAMLNGSLDSVSDYNRVDVSFQWGASTGVYTNETTPQEITSIGPFNTEINGLSSNTTYYFRAKATGSITQYGDELSFTTLASDTVMYDLPLSPGWNLVSLPLIPNSIDIEDILAGIMHHLVTAWAYDDLTKEWSNYNPLAIINSLNEMNDGDGYWVRVTIPCTLTIQGEQPTFPYEVILYPGWNLVGLPFLSDSKPIEEILADIMPELITVWAYDGSAEVWSNYNPEAIVNTLNEMDDGIGYWLRVTNPCTLTIAGP